MRMLRRLLRLTYINWTLARYGLDEIILSLHLLRPLRMLIWLNPYNWFRDKSQSPAHRLRLCIEELGPIFIKFGQMLATRRDLLSDEVADELSYLLDKVPPFPVETARAIIEAELGEPIEAIFSHFDAKVLASASISQVHAATLKDGSEVVVKIVRPDIEKRIRQDIDLLMILAKLANRYWSEATRVRPIEVVHEFEKTLLNELDLVRESANASELRRNFEKSRDLYVPQVYWEYCKRKVMVMERISGIPVSNIAELKRQNINLEKLSRRGVEVFFTQVYKHNYFHADMHPGNIFVSPERPDDPQYIAVDFGIMGSLSKSDQRYLAENFVAFFNRDYRKVALLHVDSGWVAKNTRIDEFEAAIRAVCEPMFQRPLSEISYGQLLLRLFQTAREFDMKIQPQLLLLQKTLLHIEGLGRQLYPDLDLWDTAKPFLERWLNEQLGFRAFANGLKDQLPYIAERLPQLPELTFRALDRIANNKLEIEYQSKELEKLRAEIRQTGRRNRQQILGATLVLSASLLAGLDGLSPVMAGSGIFLMPVVSWLMLLPGLWLLLRKD